MSNLSSPRIARTSRIVTPARSVGSRVGAAITTAALLLGGSACASKKAADDPTFETKLEPSATLSAPASTPPSATASARPATSTAPATGPAITRLSVTGIRCDEFTDAGGWIGYVDVTWALTRGDNVQLYGPKSNDFLGGYDAASTSATFQMVCEPNTSFLIRAVPQKGSTAGSRRTYTGKWPNSPRTTKLTVTRGSCVIGLGDFTVNWTTQGADGVRIEVNGNSFPAGASGSKTLTNQTCGAGKAYPVRVVAYRGTSAGGYRETTLTW
ncbi:hypothetical protein Cme02nite_29380 [Catellatospora methionotrophica]|uniref:Uncharacterized protein n=1 Tax=Catellatospora methionotrophica TaxID=121620 RepID=A0A8J3PGR9_9ACTN|nr:hypothetical protein [Catellatospora methionotrophica]GIG14606.1 hypothetical protein Cme02nite_29380 [Catellatospora methionotrophica]